MKILKDAWKDLQDFRAAMRRCTRAMHTMADSIEDGNHEADQEPASTTPEASANGAAAARKPTAKR